MEPVADPGATAEAVEEGPPAGSEAGEAEDPAPASDKAATLDRDDGRPVVREDGKEPARLSTRTGSLTATWTLGGQAVRFVAPIDQVSFRIGDLPTLDYPIGHVKVDGQRVTSPDRPEWAQPLMDTLLSDYGTPVQVFFDVSSVTDMVGVLDEPGAEAAGLVLGGLQVNDRKLETTLGAQFTRTDSGVTIEIPRFEVALADLVLTEKAQEFAQKIQVGDPGSQVVIEGTLEVPWFAGQTLPSFMRVPVTVQRAREIEEKIGAMVPDHVAARRRLSAYGLPDKFLDRLNLTEESYQKSAQYMRDKTTRHRQLNLGAKQEAVGRRADGRRQDE